MPDDFDKLKEVFGSNPTGGEHSIGKEVSKPVEKKNIINKLDNMLYDPYKHTQGEDDEPLEERDYMPIRGRRDGRTGCLGGLMYFVFVVSVSVILACVGWMAATDVLALNKEYASAEITLPESIFSEQVVKETGEDGATVEKTVSNADIDYVASILKDNGIIEYKSLFKLFSRVSHASRKLDPGTYVLTTDYDYRALIKKMQTGSGAAVTVELTFPEGWTMEQIFSWLDENGVADKDELYAAAADYIYNYSFLDGDESGDAARLEGFLYPDTYEFYVGMQASSAINKFLENFHSKLTADMLNQAENRGMSLKQIITVASMIECEAANDEERPLIASVIYNRLASDMPLQIDATVMYALGEHKEYLTQADTQFESPYNTYLHAGLTPGPISNPGRASITGALQPQSTEYYYYALDVEAGTHRFFTDYDEFKAFTDTQDYTQQNG